MHDVAIVGAGPAGAWAAYLLAGRGARVLLLDPSHPREKPCGGGITGRALALVAGALPQRVPAVTIRRAQFIDAGANPRAFVDLRRDALVVAGRAAFDGALLGAAQEAGATLAAERVVDVRRTTYGFDVETADGRRHAASIVVGADGANSVVRRRLVRPFSRHELSIATGYFLHGATSDEVLLEFVADPPGYIWSFPRPDHLAVGICAPADGGLTSAALRARTARWIERTGIGRGAKCEPYSWPIPSLATADLDRLTIAGDRWYLAGDAAGAVDPITREGIFFALQSAALAADAISGSADAGPRAYVDWMRAEILGELHCAGRIKAMFFRPGFTRVLLDALGRSQRIRIVMADLIAGSQRYGDLKWRLVRTCEFGYAIKALGSTLLASGPCGDSAHPAAVAPSTQRR